MYFSSQIKYVCQKKNRLNWYISMDVRDGHIDRQQMLTKMWCYCMGLRLKYQNLRVQKTEKSTLSKIKPGLLETTVLTCLGMHIWWLIASKARWHSLSSQPAITVCRNLPKQSSATHRDWSLHTSALLLQAICCFEN